MVFAHRARPQARPCLAARAEPARRPLDGVRELGRVVLREGEAVPTARISVDVADRVREPADGADDGDRAVAQRDELPETARLEPRGHEEEVRPRVDALRKRRVEAEG